MAGEQESPKQSPQKPPISPEKPIRRQRSGKAFVKAKSLPTEMSKQCSPINKSVKHFLTPYLNHHSSIKSLLAFICSPEPPTRSNQAVVEVSIGGDSPPRAYSNGSVHLVCFLGLIMQPHLSLLRKQPMGTTYQAQLYQLNRCWTQE